MRNFKKLIAMMLMLASVFFIACDEDDEEKIDLVGKWILYQTIDVETEDGETYRDEWTYNEDVDVDYYSASLIEVTDDNIINYENSAGTDYYKESISYKLDGDKIITTYEDDGEIEKDTVSYSIEGDMLVIKSSHIGEYYSYSSTVKFKKYKGTLPPASWTTALTNDDYEPDNTYLTANAIEIGSSQNHITITGDSDWFSFQAVAGETYLIQVSAYMDNYLYLYDTDGQTLLADDDDNDEGIDVETTDWGNPVLLWTCAESGTYYFEITGYDSSDEGYYNVEINTSDLTKNKSASESVKRVRHLPFVRN